MLTDIQIKYLTEDVLKEEYIDEPYWWCEKCQTDVHPQMVNYQETHDREGCGYTVILKENKRTFLSTDDFFAVVRAITERDFWFILTAFRKQYSNRHWGLATAMQQPDFIERFMIEVCKNGGVE